MIRGCDSTITAIEGASPMPKAKPRTKLKTHKGTKKRFRLSATGKAMHRNAGTSHLASRMSAKRKRHLRGTVASATVESKMVIKALAGNSY
jgi:large subunit ribosomal protein L35